MPSSISAPITACCLTCSYSSRVSGPGLCSRRSGMASLPMSCSSAAACTASIRTSSAAHNSSRKRARIDAARAARAPRSRRRAKSSRAPARRASSGLGRAQSSAIQRPVRRLVAGRRFGSETALHETTGASRRVPIASRVPAAAPRGRVRTDVQLRAGPLVTENIARNQRWGWGEDSRMGRSCWLRRRPRRRLLCAVSSHG